MKKIGLVSSKQYERKERDDLILAKSLENHGFDADIISWDDPRVEWESFSSLIFRSCWNYYYRFKEFLLWLSMVEKQCIKIWNPPDIVRWNVNKKYLLNLQNRGITVIPSIFIPAKSSIDISGVMEEKGWEYIVVKPAVGAASSGVISITRAEAFKKQKNVQKLLQSNDILIQPFYDQIREGEWSFVFIGGRFSHAVLKKPGKNEFRIHPHLGSTKYLEIPSPQLLSQVKKIYKAIGQKLLYARVDGIEIDGKFLLMEVELIEPYLFFCLYQPAADTMVQAFKNSK